MCDKLSICYAEIEELDINESVWRLLKANNDEFVPPLSSRLSTVSKTLKHDIETYSNQPTAYFEMLKTQHHLIAKISKQVVGFMSFRYNYSTPELNGWNQSNYVTTICIDANHRRKGICSAFYQYLFYQLPNHLHRNTVSTRTWSGNDAHIFLLKKFGFQLVNRVENDRGNGIASLYWAVRLRAQD